MTEKRLEITFKDLEEVIDLIRKRIVDNDEAHAIIMLREFEKILDGLDMGKYDLVVGSYTSIKRK